jgi:hypothetical protein
VIRLLLLALCLPLAVEAQIYKWVDEKGRVQYGEKPPPGAKASTLRPEASPPSRPAPVPGTAGAPADADAEFRRRQIERRQAEEAQAQDAKRRQAQCEDARNRLAAGEGAGRHFTYRGGEKVYLTDAERDASLARMRERVSQACR